MKSTAGTFTSVAVASLLVSAVVFAVTRYFAYQESQETFTECLTNLQDAHGMAARHKDLFEANKLNAGRNDLKAIVQESGARNGVPLIYLNETERDSGDKVRERNVTARAVNVPHSKLVTFLVDLETRGGGARIKEIRLKPSADKAGVYQEAESVLAIRTVVETAPSQSGSKKDAQ